MLKIGQDYSVEARDRRERLTSLFEDAMSQKMYMLRNYKLVIGTKENSLNTAKENFQILASLNARSTKILVKICHV
jgi:hypothetical protein